MSTMDPTLWKRLEELLDRILDAPPHERRNTLKRICAEHPDLEAHLESLFEAHEQQGLLDSSAESVAGLLLGAEERPIQTESSPEGRDIPPYRLLREIGRGGMGIVYLAERADGQFTKTVALKLILTGRDTDEVRRRFLLERQILARLEHPNISRLLDGGITADGRPFFVMEYVEGKPITAYADQNRLTVGERLALFESVCAAVSYAQQHLVVHRDLKPSNILVTSEGTVKLLDFGVAKLIGDWEDDAGDVTRGGFHPMTPQYAAPEQIRREAVTTATDVYALGAVLYELLTGRPHLEVHGRTAGEYERVILEEEPQALHQALTRLSRRVSETDGDAPSPDDVARSRRTGLRALGRELRGDLANIVSRALHKEPERRYSSAENLLEDLRRYRQGLTVSARRPSWAYRTRKYVRRHRLAVMSAVFLALVLTAGLLGILWEAREASLQGARATEVKEFLASLFEGADPGVLPGEELTAGMLLDRGARRVEEELSESPEIQAEIFQLIGNTYEALGHYDQSIPLHERSLAIRRDLFDEDDPRVVEGLIDLGSDHIQAAHYDVAESLYTQAQAVQERRGRRDALTARALSDMGVLRERQGRFTESEECYREAISIDRQVYGARHLEVAEDMNNLAVLLSGTGHAEEAESLLVEVLNIRRENLPPEHPDIAITLHNLAFAKLRLGHADEAESLLRELIPMRRRTHPQGHPNLAGSLRLLGQILRNQGRFAEAESLLTEALQMSRSFLGDLHEDVAETMNDLGILAYRQGDYATAHTWFRESLAIFEKLLAPDHPTIMTMQNNLAGVEKKLGRLSEAEDRYRRLLAMRRSRYGGHDPMVATDLTNLGAVVRLQGRAEEAVPLHREALAIYESSDAEPMDIGHCRYHLALDLMETGDSREAASLLRAALETYEAGLPADSPRLADARAALERVSQGADPQAAGPSSAP